METCRGPSEPSITNHHACARNITTHLQDTLPTRQCRSGEVISREYRKLPVSDQNLCSRSVIIDDNTHNTYIDLPRIPLQLTWAYLRRGVLGSIRGHSTSRLLGFRAEHSASLSEGSSADRNFTKSGLGTSRYDVPESSTTACRTNAHDRHLWREGRHLSLDEQLPWKCPNIIVSIILSILTHSTSGVPGKSIYAGSTKASIFIVSLFFESVIFGRYLSRVVFLLVLPTPSP